MNSHCICDDGFHDPYGCFTCLFYSLDLDPWIKDRIKFQKWYFGDDPDQAKQRKRELDAAHLLNIDLQTHDYTRNPAYVFIQ